MSLRQSLFLSNLSFILVEFPFLSYSATRARDAYLSEWEFSLEMWNEVDVRKGTLKTENTENDYEDTINYRTDGAAFGSAVHGINTGEFLSNNPYEYGFDTAGMVFHGRHVR